MAGIWLKRLREKRGLSQRALAKLVGAEYYTFISQLETGRGRIPPNRYNEWAAALGLPAKTFVHTLMRYYDPITYEILFGDSSAKDEVRRREANQPSENVERPSDTKKTTLKLVAESH